jgi:hypothetical protein
LLTSLDQFAILSQFIEPLPGIYIDIAELTMLQLSW